MGLSRAAAAALITVAFFLPQAAPAGSAPGAARGATASARSGPGVTITTRVTSRAVSFKGDVRKLPQTDPRRDLAPRAPLSIDGPRKTPTGTAPQVPEVVTAAGRRSPAPAQTFKGLDFVTWGAGHPPDTVGDVGPDHYIQAVNTSLGIFTKTGTQLAAFTFDDFIDGTATPCDDTNQGDVTVVYDPMSDRWIVADFAFVDVSAPPYYECIAVSKTGDPMAPNGWWFYAIRTDDTAHPDLADYPKMGIWPDGLYMTANMFRGAATFTGVRVWAFNRSDLESGLPIRTRIVDIPASTNPSDPAFSLLPANLRGTMPPAGRNNILVSESVGSYSWEAWDFHVDYDGAGSTFTGPVLIPQTSYVGAPATVPSPGNTLDTLPDRLMMQNQYRNVGGVESLWVNHTIGLNPAGTLLAVIQWAQLNVSGGVIATTSVQAQIYGNLSGDGIHRWMGSLAVDKDGGMALGYSATNSTLMPDIRYNSRAATDPPNTLPGGETSLIPASVVRGTQVGSCGGTCDRWGDYSAMTIEPDGCTFWYTQEYYETSGLDWQTRIASFQLPSCSPISSPSLSVADTSAAEGNAGTTTRTFTVSLSAPSLNGTHVDFATADGTATIADGDYVATSGTLQFNAGEISKTIGVTVNGDTTVESDETFLVNLSNVTWGTLADAQAVGTIADDDGVAPPPVPTLSINDVTLAEGNVGTTAFTFTVTRSGDTSGASTVGVATADGTATAPSDYTAIGTTTLTFSATETTQTVTVNVTRDTTVEPDETFTVDLSNPIGATLADAQGLGTITNDDSPPPPVRKPDGRIRVGAGAYVGNNVYNITGVGQSKTGSAAPGHSITFGISIQNDGTTADRFTVKATGSTVSGYRVKYFHGTTDITAAVVAGTYRTALLAPGAKFLITATVKVKSAATMGSKVTRLVTITSVGNSAKKDAVQFIGKPA